MSILDAILNNAAAPRIISSEHNLANISVNETEVAQGMAALGRVWDAAEMGISREQAEQMMRDAQTPEARERVLTNLRTRAIRRAQLDTTGGRVRAFFAGKPAWHGLGVTVDRAATSVEAIKLAGLDWTVEKVQNSYTWKGIEHKSDSHTVLRGDTGAKLGTVGARYQPIQNAQAFDFIDSVLGEFGARYETAGSLYGGTRVWMLVKLPKASFTVNGDDRTDAYGLFSNCHDGSGAGWFFPTTVRVECANTQRQAIAGKGAAALKIRHTGSIKSKIEDAKQALGLAVKTIGAYAEKAEAMVAARVDARAYAASVLEAALGISDEQARLGAEALADAMDATEEEAKTLAATIEKRNTMLDDILERYESTRCRPAGSVWAAYNAVTEHANHAKPAREAKDAMTRASRRFENVLTGEADALSQIAYTQAVAAIA